MDWDNMFGGRYHQRRKRRYSRFWSSSKIREAMHEFRNQGIDFLIQKYGNDRVRQIQSKLDGMNRRAPGRSGGGGYKVNIPGLGIRKIGSSAKNAPPRPKKGESLAKGPRVGFQDAKPAPAVPPVTGNLPNGNAFPPGTFQPRMQLNLENDSELAQGQHHPWAQTTSISSTITGLLREAQNATGNYWSQWSQNKGGQMALDTRGSGSFGTDMRWTDEEAPQTSDRIGIVIGDDGVVRYLGEQAGSQLAANNPMGGFGTSTVMLGQQAGGQAAHVGGHFEPQWETIYNSIKTNPEQWPNWDPTTNPPTYRGPNYNNQNPPTTKPPAQPNPTNPTPTNPTTPTTPTTPPAKPIELPPTPPAYNSKDPILPKQDDIFGPPNKEHEYNPWSRLEGGYNNRYGPSQQYMGQATMEAMALANAYFAPQRMELAYELGDMETDMRRLAVNLGRQVDDPVLQAKLYKEAMRATRTLDVQQNTFAFQMSEQRRREELQNFQFYDQLAQEEAKLKLANRQFYEDLELRRRQFNLDRWNVENQTRLQTQTLTAPPISSNPTPNTTTTGGGAQIVQNQFNIPGTSGASLSGIYGNLLKSNPYAGRP